MIADAGAPLLRSGGPERWFDRVAASNTASLIFLLVLAFMAFAPGLVSMPPMDRDEPRFAQATRQMLETGDFVSIRFQAESRLKKPVGIYWLQAITVSLGEAAGVEDARRTIALYRLPSFLAALACVVLTWWVGLPLVGRRASLLGGIIMAGCVLLGVEARLAKTDATLLMTVLVMIGILARAFAARGGVIAGERQSWRLCLLFWSAAAASLLVKGPIGPLVIVLLVPGIAILEAMASDDRSVSWFRRLGHALARQGKWLASLRWGAGLAWMLLLVLPWFIAIMIATKGAFLEQSLGKDMIGKVAGGQESHGAPPGTYFAVFWLTFWPFAPLLALAAPWIWRSRARPSVQFLLGWVLPTWLFFEIVPTKLPHYVLPVYPALALLIGAAVDEGALATRRWARAVMALVPLVALALVGAGLGAGWWFGHTIVAGLAIAGAFAVAAATAGFIAMARGRAVEAVLLSALAAIGLYWSIYGFGMPAVPGLWPGPMLAAALGHASCPDPAVAATGYREPGLVFLTRTDLALLDGGGAADFLAAPGAGCRVAFVDDRFEAAFQARLATLGARATLLTRVTGRNLNGFKPVDIGVYAATP